MSIQTDLIRILEEYRDKIHDGNADHAANALGVTAPTLSRWLNGVHVPRMETLIPVFEKLHAQIVLPGDCSLTSGIDSIKSEEQLRKLKKENDELTKELHDALTSCKILQDTLIKIATGKIDQELSESVHQKPSPCENKTNTA